MSLGEDIHDGAGWPRGATIPTTLFKAVPTTWFWTHNFFGDSSRPLKQLSFFEIVLVF